MSAFGSGFRGATELGVWGCASVVGEHLRISVGGWRGTMVVWIDRSWSFGDSMMMA